MDAWRYGIYLLVLHSISHSFAALTCSISMCTLEDKFHISARPCIILYVFVLMHLESDCQKNYLVSSMSFIPCVMSDCKSSTSKNIIILQYTVSFILETKPKNRLSDMLCNLNFHII